ncbi:DNA cytosine methyltransferase [Ligilactobacillus ceti]|uniref:DNA (cytosine-5-)-methyltransferase n=1 Tax=Ligilactobacillus ceti DSM 22408 TaxID=1122146 RepID=A0A0R2KH94_9LACO|nr:DNA cytosine methyltransferase [Ligilactobacillus ceti]KRN88721.1 hypothetical protein IV53_GL000688 [Ligilactobacillus ceti DSM 22408]
MSDLTLGSLFSGSGGFELGALISNITPIWNSEIEPFPIRVTTKRLPNVKHLGDITKIKGIEIEPVDIITFGSPCQDLSIAGKRNGLDGTRSSLFYEAIRIIKEMRNKTNGEKPRYIVWENVPGAFSSNKGEDFRCVLEEICKVKKEDIFIPKSTKWQNAGTIMGRDYSISWRVLDARYFGVPQRRRRIFLVADFNGQSSEQILFKQESKSWNTSKGKKVWKKATRDFRKSTDKHINDTKLVFENHGQDTRYTGPIGVSTTLGANLGSGGGNTPFVVEDKSIFDIRLTSDNTKNVRANIYKTDTSRALDTNGNNPNANQGGVAVCYSTSKSSFHTIAEKELVNTLVATDYKDPPLVNDNYIVRRLTPLECLRLQGFPDYWCDDLETENPTYKEIKFWREVFETHRKVVTKSKRPKTDKQIIKWLKNPYSDSAMYKMWGNGVALPCVVFVLNSIKNFNNNG